MRLKVATVVAFTGVLVAQISAANAAVIYSNLGTPDSTTSVAIGYNSSVNTNVKYAQGFTTGTGVYLLNSVDLALGVTGFGNGSPLLQIFSDNSGKPGTDLAATFTNPTFGAQAVYNLNLATPFSLSATTSYWIVLSDTTSASQTKFNWYYSDAFTQPTAQNGSGLTYLAGARSMNGGTTWATNDAFALTAITLNATTVPEPSTYALAAIASSIMVVVGRRRKSTIA
jgi:hypothetical protein